MLKRWGRPNVTESIGYTYHWWEQKSYIPGIWNYKLRDEEGLKIRTRLYAYMNAAEDKNRATKQMYDEIYSGMMYPDFIEHFISNKVCVDYCSAHTYGRTSVDMAAIGVPMVGSDRIESMRRCFPMTSHDPFDGKSMITSIKRLWTDDKFHDDVITTARVNSEFYNYKNSKQRFLAALEQSELKKCRGVDYGYEDND
jgi:hypothetical protein